MVDMLYNRRPTKGWLQRSFKATDLHHCRPISNAMTGKQFCVRRRDFGTSGLLPADDSTGFMEMVEDWASWAAYQALHPLDEE